ncbi:MAG: hypothetical protein U0802_26750 [Candidatus Binatia bacterium]
MAPGAARGSRRGDAVEQAGRGALRGRRHRAPDAPDLGAPVAALLGNFIAVASLAAAIVARSRHLDGPAFRVRGATIIGNARLGGVCA